ncbi:MAG: L,D-transpeptidase [Ilumatobacteraceae bacterium]
MRVRSFAPAGMVVALLFGAAVVPRSTVSAARPDDARAARVHTADARPSEVAPAMQPPAPAGADTVQRVMMAADSVPDAGWFHVVGPVLPVGTTLMRYANVDRALQTAIARHGAGPLSFWFRAPGAPGSTVTIHLEALDADGAVLRDLGTVTLTTGSALLPLPKGVGTGRRVVLDSEAQQMWLVDDADRVVGSFLVSGRRVPTESGSDQPGVFQVYSRSANMRYCEETCGTARHMVRYQRTRTASVGFHSLPVEHGVPVQTAFDLGWPLSHGCTRLADDAARYVFAWATTGTVVIVMDSAARVAVRERSAALGRLVL